MAEPIRNYTPKRDVREELRRKVEEAPVAHAEAVLSAYELLQQAQDHGVFERLRGLIGARDTLIGKISEYANMPEGVRLLRNGLAAARLLGELDPELLDAVSKAIARGGQSRNQQPPSMLRIVQRLTSADSRRALALLTGLTESIGRMEAEESEPSSGGVRVPVVVPVIAIAAIAVFISYWVGKNS